MVRRRFRSLYHHPGRAASHRPQSGSEGDKALRAAGKGGAFWDAVEMYDDAGRDRLAAYASGEAVRPLGGFWTEDEVEDFS